MSPIRLMWESLSGWKSVLGYLALQIPIISENPMLLEAVQNAILDPTWQRMLEALAQLLLAIGVTHRVAKNIKDGKNKK